MEPEEKPARHRPTRRRFVIGAAGGAAVAWTIPTITSIPAAAAGTAQPITPNLIWRADDSSPPTLGSRSVSLTAGTSVGEMPRPVFPGDLCIVIAAYDARGTITASDANGAIDLNTPSPPYLSAWKTTQGTDEFSVQAYLMARVLTASDIDVDDTYTVTFSTSSDPSTYGALVSFMIVLRAGATLALPTVTSTTGAGPIDGDGNVVVDFAQSSGFPEITPNLIVRAGVARAYGGVPASPAPGDAIDWSMDDPLDASSNPIIWSDLFESFPLNYGDRRIYIFTEEDASGIAATSKWDPLGATVAQSNWVTFTAAVIP